MAKSSLSLARLLNTPHLDRIVPRLQPEVLHQVITYYGLEDCVEFVALASPAQIARLLDMDVWRPHAGAPDVFDARRFGLWLAVMMESGVAAAADTLAGLDLALVAAGISGHLVAFDAAAVSAYVTLDGDYVEGREDGGPRAADIGGYRIEARRMDVWDEIVELLSFLAAERPHDFGALMHRCVTLSSGVREGDGFHALLQDHEQHLFDLAADREERRDALGYVTPAEARAFLQSARSLQLDTPAAPVHALARAYFRNLAAPRVSAKDTQPIQELPTAPDVGGSPARGSEVAAVIDLLADAGVLDAEPRRLLEAGTADSTRLSLVQAHVRSHAAAAGELAYLANALVAAATLQGRAFTATEASAAAAATCNLGLECWPAQWSAADLVTAFQVGWRVLYRDVCHYAAEGLETTLARRPAHDRELHLQLNGLRAQLVRAIGSGSPWRVRDDLDIILQLDTASWAGLLALLDECPIINAAIRQSGAARTISLQEFEFLSTGEDVKAARAFVARLPAMLNRES